MNILFIAPFPPPITGQTLVDEVLLDELTKTHIVKTVNLSKKSFKSGVINFKRIFEIVGVFKSVWQKKRHVDVIYFTISESFAGNLKDLIIYLICYNKLSKMVIHLHGGSIKKDLFDKSKILFNLNKYFIRRLHNVIISGKSHRDIFTDIIADNKIIIIPNFAEDYLFIEEKKIIEKFKKTIPITILFISNLIEGKGYMELVNAYLGLDDISKQKVMISIGGAADPEHIKKSKFIERIKDVENIHYHGFIDRKKKKELLTEAHVLCFPSYLMEGQGLVVLEAYAAGCVVITTASGGIKDVFEDGINGFQFEIKSAGSIQKSIEHILKYPDKLLPIAIKNRTTASKEYRTSIYTSRVKNIVENAII